MGDSSSKLREKHVVIVGGGFGGTCLASELQGKCKMTLIDPKECFHINFGALRSAVEEGFAKKTFVPYGPTYGDNFKRGAVNSIDVKGKKVVLESGEEITYDYLVLATGTTNGTTGSFPGKLDLSMKDVPEAVKMYDGIIEKIKAAKDIVIVGGGPVGVELCGEIVTDMKDKKVTLIHSGSVLIDNGLFGNKFRENLHTLLVERGVDVLLGHRVSNLDELPTDGSKRCTVKTEKGEEPGKEVEADLVFVCTGLKTNTSAYSDTFGDKMDDAGCLKVDEFLRVEGTTDVFAIGDCCTADAQAKMALHAGTHGELVAKNLQLDADGAALKPYKPPMTMMIVPVGRDGGVGQIGWFVVGSFMSKNIKSKDLFLPRIYSDCMKQPYPTD